MRKNLLVLLLLVATAYSCRTHYPTVGNQTFPTPEASAASFERGKNIAYNVCADCHYNPASHKFTGKPFTDMPRIGGKVYSANLTMSPHGALSQYSSAEFAYLMRTGITRDGRFVPYMLRPTMAEDDINDLLVFLHSRVPEVAPSDTLTGKTHLNSIGRKMVRAIARPQPVIPGIKRPAADDAVANGRYLVSITGCFHCHSKNIMKLNYTEPEKSKGYMAGGMKLKGKNGKVQASNLTPDVETGIGKYTAGELREAVVNGKARDGRLLRAPMPNYAYLTEKQVNDIYAYLKTLQPVRKVVKH